MKKCSKCGQVKDVSEFSKDSHAQDGLQFRCKICQKEDRHKWYLSNIQKNKDQVPLEKRCTKCKKTKSILDFSRHRNMPDGFQRQCQDCQKTNMANWYKDNRDDVIERTSQWHKSNPERTKIYARRCNAVYRVKFPEKISAQVAVRRAVNQGKLPPVSSLVCIDCGGKARDYHHYLGYSKEHQLDVIPLCRVCHIHADKRLTFINLTKDR